MWTRLADWVVMSNSLPQRDAGLVCGLHGWVVCVCVCNHECIHVLRADNIFFFQFTHNMDSKLFHLAFLSPKTVAKQSISEVTVT